MLMNIRKTMKSQKGFTLVELLVVVVIIGVLAAIAVPKFTGATDEAKIAKVKADLRTIASAVILYQAKNNGTIPDDVATLKAGGYLTNEPKDEGSTPAFYTISSDKGVVSGKVGSTTYTSDAL